MSVSCVQEVVEEAGQRPGPEVITLFSCPTQLSTMFILLINVKCQQLLAFEHLLA